MATHGVIIDSGIAFEIVPNTRKIIVPQMYKVIGTVGDNSSESLTFRCPRLIDGHEINACARKYVSWVNAEGQIGHDELQWLRWEGDYVCFSWLVKEGLTVGHGIVSFSVHFEDVDENGKATYRWSTTACKECEILDAINGVLGKYKAIYVSGDKLVISDYTPVHGTSLSLESDGIKPQGTLSITENGVFDVTQYAEAKVEVSKPVEAPTIEIESGFIVAKANGITKTKRLDTPIVNVQGGVATASANGLTSAGYALDKPTIDRQGDKLIATANDIESDPYTLDKPVITKSGDRLTATANGLGSEPYRLDKPVITKTGDNLTASANGLLSDSYKLDKPKITEKQVSGKTNLVASANELESDPYVLDTPNITINGGMITATANKNTASHTLTSEDCADFIPGNIILGKTIFGVTGTGGCRSYTGTITFEEPTPDFGDNHPVMTMRYFVFTDGLVSEHVSNAIIGNTTTVTLLKDSYIVIVMGNPELFFSPIGGTNKTRNVKNIFASKEIYIGQVTGDNFKLTMGW